MLGKLTYKDHKLLDRGLVELATKYREVLTKPFCIQNCIRAYPSGEKVYVNGTPIHMIVFKITKQPQSLKSILEKMLKGFCY